MSDETTLKDSIERYLAREKARAEAAFKADPSDVNSARLHEIENVASVISSMLARTG
jgi:hypothetical protein